jgi:NADPH-dependent curcumin reductase CurA
MKGRLIKYSHTVVRGLDNAPQALTQLFSGENYSKLLVELDDLPAV